MLHLILMPTEQCNFRCVYCYEDFAAGEMPRPVVDGVKALLARRVANLDLLSLSWFGGEPLLAWPIVEEVQSFASGLARDHPQVRLSSNMTTNASLLTRKRFDRLLELGVRRFQISLDGTLEAHDSTRQRRGGGGSFAAIWANLLMMRATKEAFEALLRLHVTCENRAAVHELLSLLAEKFAGDSRFPVAFKAVRRWGGPNDAKLPVLPADNENEILDQLLVRAVELGLSHQQDVFAQPGMLQGCYAAAVGSYVVRSTGELAKCTVFLGHPNNRVGTLNPDGTVALDSEKVAGWLRGVLKDEPESLKCPSRGWADSLPRPKSDPPRLIQIGQSRPTALPSSQRLESAALSSAASVALPDEPSRFIG